MSTNYNPGSHSWDARNYPGEAKNILVDTFFPECPLVPGHEIVAYRQSPGGDGTRFSGLVCKCQPSGEPLYDDDVLVIGLEAAQKIWQDHLDGLAPDTLNERLWFSSYDET